MWIIEIPEKDYYLVGEVARILGLSTGTLYNRIRQGTVHAKIIDDEKRITHKELVRLFEEQVGKREEEPSAMPLPAKVDKETQPKPKPVKTVNPAKPVKDVVPDRDKGRKTPIDFL